MNELQTAVTIASAMVVVIGGCWVAWRKWLKGPWASIIRFFTRVDQTINGKPAELDAWGRESSAAIPPLAEQMTSIQQTVQSLSDNDARLNALEATVAAHGQQLADLTSGHQVERMLGKVESVQALKTMETIAKSGDSDDNRPDA
jgi:hypothetical protein